MKLVRTLSVTVLFLGALMMIAPVASAQHGHGRGGYRGHRDTVRVGFGYAPVIVEPAGHYELVTRQVWHEGYTKVVQCPAEYETRRDGCGRTCTVLIRPARTEYVQVPGWYETVTERVWVPAPVCAPRPICAPAPYFSVGFGVRF